MLLPRARGLYLYSFQQPSDEKSLQTTKGTCPSPRRARAGYGSAIPLVCMGGIPPPCYTSLTYMLAGASGAKSLMTAIGTRDTVHQSWQPRARAERLAAHAFSKRTSRRRGISLRSRTWRSSRSLAFVAGFSHKHDPPTELLSCFLTLRPFCAPNRSCSSNDAGWRRDRL